MLVAGAGQIKRQKSLKECLVGTTLLVKIREWLTRALLFET